MKHPIRFLAVKQLLLLLLVNFFTLTIWAQEEGSGGSESSTTTTTTKSTNVSITSDGGDAWYTSPWVWVAGAAVFILLLVALLSNRGRDTVRVSRTVERDRGNG